MKRVSTHARTTEVDDTSDRIIVKYHDDPKVADDSVLTTVLKDITDFSDRITDAIRRDKQFSEMEDADAVRDKNTRILYRAVAGYAVLPVIALSEPAKRILAVLDKYGLNMLRENYAQQSSHMEAMSLDLSAPGIVEDAKALQGVTELIANVGTSQTEFTKKRVAYEQAYAAAQNIPSATELKNPLLQLINAKLIPYLEVMKGINAEKYGLFADSVEKIIADTNAVVERRSGASEVKK